MSLGYGPLWPPERLAPIIECNIEGKALEAAANAPPVRFNVLWVTMRWGCHPADINPTRKNPRPSLLPFSYS